MKDNELMHHGVLGMKWGVRRYQSKDGSLTAAGKKRYDGADDSKRKAKSTMKSKSVKSTENKERSVKDLSESELQEKIKRLELEKRYKELSKSPPKPSSKGKAFVMDVLEKSGKNIAVQFTTYVMGTGVNKMFKNVFEDDAIINPKKGQKDK